MTDVNPLLTLGSVTKEDMAAATEQPTGYISLSDLAEMNTDQIRELSDKADAMLLRQDKYTLGSGEEVRTMLDLIKGKMSGDGRFDVFDLAQMHGYVRSVMVTLRSNPEYDSILLPEDVHAVCAYAQAQFQMSANLVGMKVESEVKSASKAASKRAVTNAMANQMAAAMGELFKDGIKL